nr:hypothetical protein [uncultured Campylobacter sp.]
MAEKNNNKQSILKETKNLDSTFSTLRLATESDNSAFNKLVKFVTQKPKTENNKK